MIIFLACIIEISACLNKPDPTLTSSATSAATENIRSEVVPITSFHVNQIWLLVVRSSREMIQRQSFHMWWSSSCYSTTVSRTTWRFLQQHVNNTFLHWQHCIEQEAGYKDKWSTETKYTSELYFCFWFHFNTLSGCKKTNMEALLTEHPV